MSNQSKLDAFFQPPKKESEILVSTTKKPRREASVYDAVAGRVAYRGFLPRKAFGSKNRDTLSSSTVSVPPEKVLFRRRKAPERYEEDDFYWADRHLTPGQLLPDSDLLKAIHTYASDFYGRATIDKGQGDFQSMDETALLALGILLEESAKESLGETGDLVFVEGEEVESDDGPDVLRGSNGRTSMANASTKSSSGASNRSGESMSRKRRKLSESAAENV